MKYRVEQRYSSVRQCDGSNVVLGPWAKGDEVELDEDSAAYIEKDAPGTLEEAKSTPPRAIEKPPADRMQRKPATRSKA